MKKLISVILVCLMLCTMCLSVSAAGNSRFLHSYYAVVENYLVAFGAKLPAGGSCELSVASQKDLPFAIVNIAQAELGTTFYCVVDTSTALPNQAWEREIEILQTLNSSMRSDDIMVIMTVGDNIRESEPLTTTEQRNSAISALKKSGSKTDLFKAVCSALDSLETYTSYTYNCCLLVLSDGYDDGKSSVTETMALERIEKSRIAVFGVGMLQNAPSDYSRTLTQTLERMAMASVGGQFFETSSQGMETSKIADEIWESTQESILFQVDLSDLKRDGLGDSFLMTVRYDNGNIHYEDSITIMTIDLEEQIVVEPETEPSQVTEATERKDDPVKPEPPIDPIWLIAGAAAAVAVVLIIVALVVHGKKKKDEQSKQYVVNGGSGVDEIGATSAMDEQPTAGETTPIQSEKEVFTGIGNTMPVEGNQPMLKVRLTVIGHGDQVFDFTLIKDKPVVIGRNNRADLVLKIHNEVDPKLSSKHCTLQWTDGKLFVSDNRSTNGTYVNGSSVIPGSVQQIENDATLRIGAREYRVNMKEL